MIGLCTSCIHATSINLISSGTCMPRDYVGWSFNVHHHRCIQQEPSCNQKCVFKVKSVYGWLSLLQMVNIGAHLHDVFDQHWSQSGGRGGREGGIAYLSAKKLILPCKLARL